MESVAPGVYSAPVQASHVYVIADGAVVVDTGLARDQTAVLTFVRAALPRGPRLIFLTHGDTDHISSAAAVKESQGGKIAAGSVEREYLEQRARYPGLKRLIPKPPVQVELTLEEGDRVGDFRVVASPGHTPGHLSLFRDVDGVLIAGDALMTRGGRLRSSPAILSTDTAQAKASFEKLLSLRPRLILPGHGSPLRLG